MKIANYKTLINNLPVRQQSFLTKRKTWHKAESEIDWLKSFNDKIFDGKANLSVSRQDVFETVDVRELILKAIYWGYPRGMRGNHFVNILKHIDLIETTVHQLKQIEQPTIEDFIKLTTTFKSITGLGLSTYSKWLYFLQISFNNNPCLILDQRLIDVIAIKTYPEFENLSNLRYENAEKKYLDFLHVINDLAKKLETNGENIEQFLFIFGNNLKNSDLKPTEISNTWNGYCPESLIKGNTVRMRLNKNDFFESEETGLQIFVIRGVQAVILNFRGKGKFKTTETYGDEIENGELLSPQNTEMPPFNNPVIAFDNSDEIENYISKIPRSFPM